MSGGGDTDADTGNGSWGKLSSLTHSWRIKTSKWCIVAKNNIFMLYQVCDNQFIIWSFSHYKEQYIYKR